MAKFFLSDTPTPGAKNSEEGEGMQFEISACLSWNGTNNLQPEAKVIWTPGFSVCQTQVGPEWKKGVPSPQLHSPRT